MVSDAGQRARQEERGGEGRVVESVKCLIRDSQWRQASSVCTHAP